MKTTNYLIELIIAGLSTVIWVSLLILSTIDLQTILNYNFLNKDTPYVTIAAITLPFVYVIGVFVDRVFDSLFDDWLLKKHKYKHIKSYNEYAASKAKLFLSSDALIDKFEYNRTKIRICRTWIFSSLLIWISMVIFMFCQNSFLSEQANLSNYAYVVITLILLPSGFLSYYAWKTLIDKEDKFLHYSINEINKGAPQNLEIERKYLVEKDRLPINLDTSEYEIIKQWYISKFPVIRVRKIEEKYILTIKSKGEIKRIEHEINLTDEEFQNVKGLIKTHELQKYRYRFRLEDGLIAEIDVFKSPPFEKLITVEVEFESMEEAGNFNPPSWFGKDLSYDPAYKNSNMARDLEV